MPPRQQSFLPNLKVPTRLDFGGDLNQNKRKQKRPFCPKRPLHVVLRSVRARGAWSLLHPKHAARVELEVRRIAERHRVKVYRFVNVGNHLHILVHAKRHVDFKAFLRGIAGAIAHLVTGAKKGRPLEGGSFWEKLAYSRVVSWGREWEIVCRYFLKNLFEAAGFWNRKRDPHLKFMFASMREAGVAPS